MIARTFNESVLYGTVPTPTGEGTVRTIDVAEYALGLVRQAGEMRADDL